MNWSGARRRRLLFPLLIVALLWLSALYAFRRGDGDAPLTGGDFVRPQFAGLAGINLDSTELGDPLLLSHLDRLAPGIQWLRFTLPWDAIEPAPGQFAWSQWDAIFAALAGRPSLELVVVLDRSPRWARAANDSENPLAPPHERRDFGAFAAAVAQRYGGQVRYYQVWHEPNIAPHWGARPVDAGAYLGLLREAAVQLRAADPDAQIVLAGLAPTVEAGGANLSDLDYLDQLYRLGGRAWFDVVAAQPYGFSEPPDTLPRPEALNFSRVGLLREVMRRHGDEKTPLWATAFGWNALPAGWAGPPSPWGEVTEGEQARYTDAALAQVRASWPWLGPLFWPALCPARPVDDPWLGFVLCAADGSARPVAGVLAAAATGPTVLAPGRYAPDHPALRYNPGWRVTPAAADPSNNGDALAFDFLGRGLALRVQGGPYWAYYRVAIDGAPANALPRDETGAAYLVLHDPAAAARWVTVARGLAPGQHAVRLEAVGGWGQWALQGIAVTERPAARPRLPWGLIGLAGLATAAWVVWVMVVRSQAGRSTKTIGIEASAGFSRAAPDRQKPQVQDGGRRSSGPAAISALRVDLPEWLAWAAGLTLAGILVLSPWFIADLAALAGLGLLFIVRPDLSLPFIAASLPFWQQPKRLLGWEFGHFELFLWLALLALAARWALQATGVRRQGSGGRGQEGPSLEDLTSNIVHRTSNIVHRTFVNLDYPILALLLCGLASTVVATEQGVAWREFRIVFLFGAAFYWLITRVPWPAGRPFSWRPLVGGLLAGMVAASLIALWQLLTGQGRIAVEGVWRVAALYGSPNNLALVLDRGVPLALALALAPLVLRRPSRQVAYRHSETLDDGAAAYGPAMTPCASGGSETRRKRECHKQRPAGAKNLAADSSGLSPLRMTEAAHWLFAAAAVVMLLACSATLSKGALLLGLPVGIGVVLLGGAWRSGRRWPLGLLAGLIAVAAVGLALLFRTPRFADLFNFEAGTSFLRLKLWQGAWNMALDHPILGVGPDNFLYAYRTHYVLPSAWEELNLSHPHSLPLDLWTRLGLVGVAAGGWALIAALRAAWQAFRSGEAEHWPLALGLLAGLAATVTHGLIDNSLFLPDLMGLFVVAVGLLRRLEE